MLTKEEREAIRVAVEPEGSFCLREEALALLADLEVMGEALEPFLKLYLGLPLDLRQELEDDWAAQVHVTYGDLRRAAEAKGE
jgi:hypothetical protein